MTNVADLVHAALRLRLGGHDYARLCAITPGAATDELTDRLRRAPRSGWTALCAAYARDRAQEACTAFKDGDFVYRDGDYIWGLWGVEVEDALRAVGCRRRRAFLEATQKIFVEVVERHRTRRLGPPEQRHRLDHSKLEWSPTLGDMVDRAGDQ